MKTQSLYKTANFKKPGEYLIPISEDFIIPSLKYKISDLSNLSDNLYFVIHWNRNNIAFDNNRKIRRYTTSSIPSYNLELLSNGNFIATEDATNNFLDMYEFDIVGRIHAIYHLDNRIHHSIKAIPNNKIIVPSEWSQCSGTVILVLLLRMIQGIFLLPFLAIAISSILEKSV